MSRRASSMSPLWFCPISAMISIRFFLEPAVEHDHAEDGVPVEAAGIGQHGARDVTGIGSDDAVAPQRRARRKGLVYEIGPFALEPMIDRHVEPVLGTGNHVLRKDVGKGLAQRGLQRALA